MLYGNPIYQPQKRYQDLKPKPSHPVTPLQQTMPAGIFSELNCLKIPPKEDVKYNEMASAATQRCAQRPSCPVPGPPCSRRVWSELRPKLIEFSTGTPNSQRFGTGQEPSQGQTESKTPKSFRYAEPVMFTASYNTQ